MRFLLSLSILLLLLAEISHSQSTQPFGELKGRVVSAKNKSAIPGAHITLLDTNMLTVSSEEGTFSIPKIPAGIYSVRISFMGYQTRTITDVVIRGNRTATITAELHEDLLLGDELTVTAGFFDRNDTEIISIRTLNAEEIRRSPGSAKELSRVISTTAGVATTGDSSQDVMVRGGSPHENGFYINNIFIPAIYHFEEINGSSNGPVGLINTDLIQDIIFSSGGFSPTYGNRMSSMTNIRYRQGDRNRQHTNLDVDMAGFGATIETPYASGNGSVIIAGRRSYLDLLADALDFGRAPRFGDIQAKGVYESNRQNRITLLQIYGNSFIKSDQHEGLENGWLSFYEMNNQQNTTGIEWRRIGGSSFYSSTSFSYSLTGQRIQRWYVDDESTEVDYKSRNNYFNFRNSNWWNISNGLRMEFGAELMYQTGEFDYFFDPRLTLTGDEASPLTRNLESSQFSSELFGNLIIKPAHTITVNAGARIGHNSINNALAISPRAAISWNAAPRLTLNSSAGIYRQNLPLFIRSQQPGFIYLQDPYSIHTIAGASYLLGKATLLSLEIYDKQYRQLPIQSADYDGGFPEFVLDSRNTFSRLHDNGAAYSRGVDIMLQRKVKDGFYGSVSGSFFRSRFKDFNGVWQNRDYDVRFLANFISGFRPNEKWDLSTRWTYIGGRPYTPIDPALSEQFGRAILHQNQFNTERLPAFHSLYLRIDRRVFRDRSTVVLFVETWNSYNRANVDHLDWNRKTSTIEEIRQIRFLPIAGFSFEF